MNARYDVSGYICPYQRSCDYNRMNNVTENKSYDENKLKSEVIVLHVYN